MKTKPILEGQKSLYASGTIFAFVSLSVKFASRYYTGIFISASRFAIGVVLCAAAIAWRKPRFDRSMLAVVLFRGLFGSISMVATYMAISLTGPGRATLLSNTYPVFVVIFGALFFGEKMSVRVVASLVLCTIGAIFVVRDNSGAALAGDLLALGGAVFAGIAINFVRKASVTGVDPFILYLSPCVFGLALFAVAPLPPASGNPVGGLLLVLGGAGAFLSQALMAQGYRTVPANKGSIVFYWETALTVALGALFAGESLNLRFIIGLAFIVAGLWANRQAGLERG